MGAAGEPKVILITGTSTGIGLCLAVELASRGQRVFASMRDLGKAGPLQAAADAAGASLDIVQLDVTSEASVKAAVDHVVDTTGRIDVAVNNAAIFAYGPVEFASMESVHAIFDTNIFGPIRVIQAVLPTMRRQGAGRIVNVGSVAAEPRIGTRLMALYGATKASLHALSLDLNKEVATLGIEVVLCEGGVGGQTSMVNTMHEGLNHFGLGDGAYACVEATARAFSDMYDSNAGGPEPTATMIADVCLAERAELRGTLEAQATLDLVRTISDEDYLTLCAYQDAPTILAKYGIESSVWLLP
jgi:NAD(P)-dependent dehydrogenase (short-subunit alcohol dehydrogenase family)